MNIPALIYRTEKDSGLNWPTTAESTHRTTRRRRLSRRLKTDMWNGKETQSLSLNIGTGKAFTFVDLKNKCLISLKTALKWLGKRKRKEQATTYCDITGEWQRCAKRTTRWGRHWEGLCRCTQCWRWSWFQRRRISQLGWSWRIEHYHEWSSSLIKTCKPWEKIEPKKTNKIA